MRYVVIGCNGLGRFECSPGSAPTVWGTSKGEKGKRFQTLNINNLYQGPSSRPQHKLAPHKQGLQSLGKVPTARRAPANLPSLKAEGGSSLDGSTGNGWLSKEEKAAAGNAVDGKEKSPTTGPLSRTSGGGAGVDAGASMGMPQSLWRGKPGQSFLNQRSPLFGQEFPSLQAQEESANGTLALKSGGIKTEHKYGPGPALRPQNSGTWAHGGGSKPVAPVSSAKEETPSAAVLSVAPPVVAPPKPENFLAHFDVSTTSPLLNSHHTIKGVDLMSKKMGGLLNKKTEPVRATGPPHQQRSRNPIKETQVAFQGSIIDKEKLMRLDDLESCNDDWTRSDDDFDYNKKLASDDEEGYGDDLGTQSDKGLHSMNSGSLGSPSNVFAPTRHSTDVGDWMKPNVLSSSPNFLPPDNDIPMNLDRRFDSEEDRRRYKKKEEVMKNIERARRRREEEESKYGNQVPRSDGNMERGDQHSLNYGNNKIMNKPDKRIPLEKDLDPQELVNPVSNLKLSVGDGMGAPQRFKKNSPDVGSYSNKHSTPPSHQGWLVRGGMGAPQRFKKNSPDVGSYSNKHSTPPSHQGDLMAKPNSSAHLSHAQRPEGNVYPNDVEMPKKKDGLTSTDDERGNRPGLLNHQVRHNVSRDHYSIHTEEASLDPNHSDGRYLARDSKETSPQPKESGVRGKSRGGKANRGSRGSGGLEGGQQQRARDSNRGGGGNGVGSTGPHQQSHRGGGGGNTANTANTANTNISSSYGPASQTRSNKGNRGGDDYTEMSKEVNRRDNTADDLNSMGSSEATGVRASGWFPPRGLPSRRGRGNHSSQSHHRTSYVREDDNHQSTPDSVEPLSEESQDDDMGGGGGSSSRHPYGGGGSLRSNKRRSGGDMSMRGGIGGGNEPGGIGHFKKQPMDTNSIQSDNSRRGGANNRYDSIPATNPAKRQSPKQQVFDRRQNKLPPRLAKQREQNRQSSSRGGMGGSNPSHSEEEGPSSVVDTWARHDGTTFTANDETGGKGVQSFKLRSEESQAEASNQPVETIIFENTNLRTNKGFVSSGGQQQQQQCSNPDRPSTMKGQGKIDPSTDNSNPNLAVSHPMGFSGRANKHEDVNTDLKFDFTTFDTEIPHQNASRDESGTGVLSGKAHIQSSNKNSSSIHHPSAEDLNMKIASVKKVWDSNSLSAHESRTEPAKSSHFAFQDNSGPPPNQPSKAQSSSGNILENGDHSDIGDHHGGRKGEAGMNNGGKARHQDQHQSQQQRHHQQPPPNPHHQNPSGNANNMSNNNNHMSGNLAVASVASSQGVGLPSNSIPSSTSGGVLAGNDFDRRAPLAYNRLVNSSTGGISAFHSPPSLLAGQPHSLYQAFQLDSRNVANQLYPTYAGMGQSMLLPTPSTAAPNDMFGAAVVAAAAGGHNQYSLGHNPSGGSAQYAANILTSQRQQQQQQQQQANLINSKVQGPQIGPIGSKAGAPGNGNPQSFHQASGQMANPANSPLLIQYDNSGNPYLPRSGGQSGQTAFYQAFAAANSQNQNAGRQQQQSLGLQGFNAVNQAGLQSMAPNHIRGQQQHPQTMGMQYLKTTNDGGSNGNGNSGPAVCGAVAGGGAMKTYDSSNMGSRGGGGPPISNNPHPPSSGDEMAYNPTPIQRPQGSS
ncbi:uncharacterized transmembrane protein DDB_G0289901-like [Tigriopus californicus]|uniref:uncharacterized transmembrane protein DDB_G0289901-like n=1 Tax=Tigriopus californicus TaxID=6832 RepID=UPI0027DA3C3D|nr:uncharacterized transmembrane protein DDB_G0289901-like [Tigriopus californicus]